MDHGDQHHLDRPALSRGPGGDTVEIRGYVPRRIANLLDGASLGKRMPSRWDLIQRILTEWCDEYEHEHTVAAKVIGSNPHARNCGGGSAS